MRTFKFLVTFGCLATLAAPVVAQSGIGWLTDWRAARDLAQSQNRPVLLHFWSNTCVPCKQLDRNVFTRGDVARAVSGFVAVKINVDQSPELAQFYEIESVPTDIIVDPNGVTLMSSPSPHDPNQYIAMLDSVKAQFYSGLGASRVARSGGTPATQTTTYPTNNGQALGGRPSQQTTPNGRGSSLPAFAPNQGRAGIPPARNSAGANSRLDTNPAQHANVAPQYANPFGGPVNPTQASTAKVQWNQHVGGSQTPTGNYGASNPGRGSAYGGATTQGALPGNPTGITQSGVGNPSWSQQPTPQSAPSRQVNPQLNPRSSGAFTAGNQTPGRQASTSRPQSSPSGPQMGLDGYCPVSLVEQHTWATGDRRWGARHRGRVYLFSNEASQQRFFSNPDAYSPVLSGFDPVRYGERGQLVEGRRQHGLIFGNQYYLFADEASLEQFRSNPQRYVAIAQQAMRQTAERQQPR